MGRKFAITGFPLHHTLSPPIHDRLFKLDNKEGEYVKMDIPPEEFKNYFEEFKSLDGFNITAPHKLAIMELCDTLDITAQRYGAVNCIHNSNGEIIGYNTDVLGFVKSIEQLGASLNSKVAIIGCGGVGRMMAFETLYQGGQLTLGVLANDFPIAEEFKADALKVIPNAKVEIVNISNLEGEFDLMVNASPVGMYPNNGNSPVGISSLKNVKFLFDAVYNPRKTLLMELAQLAGVKTLGGMAMLVWQAVAAHEIWDNSTYDIKDIQQLIYDMEQKV